MSSDRQFCLDQQHAFDMDHQLDLLSVLRSYVVRTGMLAVLRIMYAIYCMLSHLGAIGNCIQPVPVGQRLSDVLPNRDARSAYSDKNCTLLREDLLRLLSAYRTVPSFLTLFFPAILSTDLRVLCSALPISPDTLSVILFQREPPC